MFTPLFGALSVSDLDFKKKHTLSDAVHLNVVIFVHVAQHVVFLSLNLIESRFFTAETEESASGVDLGRPPR